MGQIPVGLMGCGVVADYGHLPILKAHPGLRLHAIFDPDERRLRAAQAKFGVPEAFTDQEAFLASGIEAVSITSPAPCHRANAVAAARHRLPILCEKPLALTEADMRAMIAAAAEAGVPLWTGFDYRFSPVAQTIRKLLREGAIGEARSLRLIYIWNCHGKYIAGPDGQLISSPRRDGRMDEGGPMVDCGVHQIDLARWWLGSEAVRTTAASAWVDEYPAPDHVWLHLDHACGAHTMVEISYSYCHTAAEPINQFTYELIGTEGLIRFDRGARTFELRNRQGTTALPFAHEKNFAGMYDEFARCLREGVTGDLPTGADGLAVSKLAQEATDRLIAQRPVRA